jgi:hypothetical protein
LYISVKTHKNILALFVYGCLSKGITTIEKINLCCVPILFFLILVGFYYSLFLPKAAMGVALIFRMDWSSLKERLKINKKNNKIGEIIINLYFKKEIFSKRGQERTISDRWTGAECMGHWCWHGCFPHLFYNHAEIT